MGPWAESEEAALRVRIGMKTEAGDQKEIAVIALSRKGQPSQPCLGAVKLHLASWQRQQGEVTTFKRKTKHCDIQ